MIPTCLPITTPILRPSTTFDPSSLARSVAPGITWHTGGVQMSDDWSMLVCSAMMLNHAGFLGLGCPTYACLLDL